MNLVFIEVFECFDEVWLFRCGDEFLVCLECGEFVEVSKFDV